MTVFWLLVSSPNKAARQAARPAERLGIWRDLNRARCLPRWLDEAAAAGRRC